MRTRSRCASFAIIVLLVLCGSADAWFETRDAKLQAVKTIGIIAAVGDQFTFATGGLTGLDNNPRSIAIAAWDLDDLIVQQATTVLSSRFQVQPVIYRRSAFATVKESPVAPVTLVAGDPIKKLVQTEVSPQGLDAYIVITKAKANFGATSRKIEGIGLLTYNTVSEAYSQIHALYEIRVIDGKTFDIIEKAIAAPLDDASSVRLPGPSRLIDKNFPIESSDARDADLYRAVVDLITRSLPITLRDMRLSTR